MKQAMLMLMTLAVVMLAGCSSAAMPDQDSAQESMTQDAVRSEPAIKYPVYSLSANFVRQETMSEMAEMADLIVAGYAVQPFDDREQVTTTYADGEVQDFYTLTAFQVEQVLKDTGEKFTSEQNPVINIVESVMTREMDGQTKLVTLEQYIPLPQGEQMILFLAANNEDNYSVLNRNLGKFALDEAASPTYSPDERGSYQQFREDVFALYVNE
jgi:hypothetical protein